MAFIRDRRSFLKTAAAFGAAITVPQVVRAAERPENLPTFALKRPVRIRGRVHSGGRGIERVAVTDGFTVVPTDSSGAFEVLSDTGREFVSVSIPSGYRFPLNPTGTSRHYRPIAVGSSDEMLVDFDLDRLVDSDEKHSLFLLSDIQVQDMDEVTWFHEQTVPDVIATREFLGGECFGLACGDTVYDRFELFPEYERAVTQMRMPFFQVLGNHDMDQDAGTDRASTATFSRHFGPRYYSFNRGEVHYVVLDDVFWHSAGYIGYLDADQLAWLEADLSLLEPGSTVFVMAHIPILGGRHVRRGASQPNLSHAVTNRQMLYRLLEPFNAHILTGHTHENEHLFEHGVHEHVNGTVSGAWWSGPICGDGTPSGYSVYELDGSNVSWRYKSTGYDFDHQIRVYGRGADPKAPDEIVANIWDWDPAWKVNWYEGGVLRGEMARRTSLDPLSVELHSGSDLPPRRTWVDPYLTDHLFYAPAASENVSIVVEATDRFGRVYTAGIGG